MTIDIPLNTDMQLCNSFNKIKKPSISLFLPPHSAREFYGDEDKEKQSKSFLHQQRSTLNFEQL